MNLNEEDFLPYDDDAAIKFIRNQIPQELKEKIGDDDLCYIVDLIYEFYEEKGFLDDEEAEVEIDIDELTTYVVSQAKKDKVGVYTEEEIRFVVDAEIEYCDSIGLFD
jgi:hypothetical protein